MIDIYLIFLFALNIIASLSLNITLTDEVLIPQVRIEAIDHNSVHLSWTPLTVNSSSENFRLHYAPLGSTKHDAELSLSPNQSLIAVEGLQANTTYFLELVASPDLPSVTFLVTTPNPHVCNCSSEPCGHSCRSSCPTIHCPAKLCWWCGDGMGQRHCGALWCEDRFAVACCEESASDRPLPRPNPLVEVTKMPLLAFLVSACAILCVALATVGYHYWCRVRPVHLPFWSIELREDSCQYQCLDPPSTEGQPSPGSSILV